MDHFEEALRIAQLVIDRFLLEGLSPNQKNSKQLPHLLLVVLELVDSVDISRTMRVALHIISRLCFILVYRIFVIIGWKFEITNVLINLSEHN